MLPKPKSWCWQHHDFGHGPGNTAFPGPFQWTCGGQQLEIVVDFKYLGILFNAVYGMAVTFPMLKKKTFGAWALLKRQYGRLRCLASFGLMFRVYEACVPPTAAYACEIWGFQQFSQQYGALRLELATSHLQMLKEITSVRAALVLLKYFNRHSLGGARPEVLATCLASTGCQIL